MKTITKKDLVDAISERTGQRRTAVKQTVQEFLDLIIEELAEGNRLEFRDFGVFESKERAARTAQNPKTLERVAVPAKRTVKFKVGRRMRDAMDGPLAGAGAVVATSDAATPAPTPATAAKTQPIGRDADASIEVKAPAASNNHKASVAHADA